MLLLASLLSGFIFGCGLLISGMVSPTKVLVFLDVARWLGSEPRRGNGGGTHRNPDRRRACAATWPALPRGEVRLPTKTNIDAPLVFGAMLFGVGWGLVGLCPGPAVANLATLSPQVLVFVAAMLAGMALFDWSQRRLSAGRRARSAATPVKVDG